MNKIIKKSFISIFLVSLIYSCGDSATNVKVSPTPTPSYPLYLRLGNNKEAISVIIDDTFQNVAINDTIKAQFADILNDPNRLTQLKNSLVDYVCQVSGGGCVYNNANTQTINLDANQYTSFKADLNKTLDKFKILTEDKNDLNTVFDPSKVGIFTIVAATPAPATTPTGSSSPISSSSPSVVVSGQPGETSSSPTVSPEVSVSPTVSASPQVSTSPSASVTN